MIAQKKQQTSTSIPRRVVTLIFIRFHSDLGDDADRSGDGICKRKSCGPTSDGRPKRTRKTTKGDGWKKNYTGGSQVRIRDDRAEYKPAAEDGSE
jgi:hypothetical protein